MYVPCGRLLTSAATESLPAIQLPSVKVPVKLPSVPVLAVKVKKPIL